MPVLQGYSPESYAAHVDSYGEFLTHGQWVRVGSVCKRNGNPDQIEYILLAIKTQRPGLRLACRLLRRLSYHVSSYSYGSSQDRIRTSFPASRWSALFSGLDHRFSSFSTIYHASGPTHQSRRGGPRSGSGRRKTL